MTTTPRILVGYDGAAPARHAMTWAAEEATRRDWPLVVAMAHALVPLGTMRAGSSAAANLALPAAQEREERQLSEAVDALRTEFPDLDITARYVSRSPAGYLVEESANPGLVVLGTRGLGGVKAALLGGVADEVVTHARGPVCIVPESRPGTGPIVVGVDEGDSWRDAVRYALEEARAAGCPVELVHCLDIERHLPMAAAVAVMPTAADPELADSRRFLDSVLEEVRGWDSGVEVSGRVGAGAPAHLLVEASADARLTVVGSRGRGGFTGLLLGSTSRQTVRDTRGPAVVVPSTEH